METTNMSKKLKQSAENLIKAWESLSGGNHSPRIIGRWLLDDMKPAIDELREALKTK